MYVYIYIYTHTYTLINMYAHIYADQAPPSPGQSSRALSGLQSLGNNTKQVIIIRIRITITIVIIIKRKQ